MRRHVRSAAIVAAACVLVATVGHSPSGSAGIAAARVDARLADASSDALIHADASRALGYTGKGVTVAVIDTGIDDHHPDLAGSVTAEHCFVPPDGCPDGAAEQDGPGSAQDDQGHGTAIADVIAGHGDVGPVGVAPDASLVVVKVADHNGRTSAAQIVAGLNWVLTHHPEARIVNVSLGSDVMLSGDCNGLTASMSAYGAAIDALRAQGATVFASSGNGGSRYSITAPACIHAAVAVGAVYSRNFGSYTAPFVCRDTKTAADRIACFSNSSTELDLLAVGAPVDAADLGSGDSLLAGTSVAAAQAAGAAAVLLQADPGLTPDSLLSLLERTGIPITDPRNHFTTPRIDLAAALGAVLGRVVPLPSPPGSTETGAAPTLSAPTVPRADLSVAPISFGSVALTRAVTRRLVVRNSGAGYLTVRVSTSLPEVSARPAKLVIPATGHGTVRVTFRPGRAGVYRGQLRLETDDPSAPRIAVAVRGTGRS